MMFADARHGAQVFDFRLVEAHLANGYQGPVLLVDSRVLRHKARRFHDAMPRVQAHYAVKCNSDPRVLAVLHEEEVRFEIASRAELETLLALGIPAHQVFYSNPIKARSQLGYAAARGVQWYVVDSIEELDKVIAVKPDARLYLRIKIPNDGALWPLTGKFGADAGQQQAIIERALRIGADLTGVTFHVGSQCVSLASWKFGIRRASEVFELMLSKGLRPSLLNLGGGFPVRLGRPVPTIEQIGAVINDELKSVPAHIRVIAEPGRYLVSDSACFVCQVIGTTMRNGKRWAYLDAGTYNGLSEVTDRMGYRVFSDGDGPLTPWTLAGPTCDSVDICTRNQRLGSGLREGNLVFVENAGAYSSACATSFNGFAPPHVEVV